MFVKTPAHVMELGQEGTGGQTDFSREILFQIMRRRVVIKLLV